MTDKEVDKDIEKNLLKEVNELRTNPKGFAEKIEKNKQYYKGKIYKYPDDKNGVKTEECAEAYDEPLTLKKKVVSVGAFTPL